MIAELKRRNLYDNTLILYTADHGEFLGFHHLLLKGGHMYEPLIKVPLIVKFPGQRQAGTVSSVLASSIDVTASILKEAGLPLAPDMRGQPLQDVLSGGVPARSLVFAEDGTYAMVRSRTRKLLHTSRPAGSLFFNLERDPLELTNLIDDPGSRAEIQELKDALLSWYQKEAVAGPFLDLQARQIQEANVPGDRAAAEQAMEGYIDAQMRKALPRK
jgi:arylsulfatase A-like enzyme